MRPHLFTLRRLLFIALPLIASGCGGAPDLEVSIEVPALPEYVKGFEESVLEVLQAAHQELLADPQDPERWMKAGMVLEAHREAALAQEYYLGALALRDDNAKWWYRLALAREESDQIEGALDAFAMTIELDPSYAPAFWRTGGWKLEMGLADEARKCFERVLELDSNDPAGILGLVQVHIWLGQNERAVAALEGNPVLDGRNGPWAKRQLGTAYQRTGRVEEARVLLASTRSAKPLFVDTWETEITKYRRGAAAVNRKARELIARGAAREAIEMLLEAHEQEPDHVPILHTLSAAYAATGETQSALDRLRMAVQLNPDNVELQVDATWAQALNGDLSGALKAVDEIIERFPTNAKAHALRAQLLLDSGKLQEAVDAFDVAMGHGHRDPGMLVSIAKVLMQLEQHSRALECFVRASAQDPALQEAWIGQAICALDLGRLNDAAKALARAEEFGTTEAGGEAAILSHVRSQLAALRAAETSK